MLMVVADQNGNEAESDRKKAVIWGGLWICNICMTRRLRESKILSNMQSIIRSEFKLASLFIMLSDCAAIPSRCPD